VLTSFAMCKAVTKAVITAAGLGTRHYPATNSVQKELFPLVDRDGITKPVIQIIAEEALAAGIEEICIVTRPAVVSQFQAHFQSLSPARRAALADKQWAVAQSQKLARMKAAITYVYQETPAGFGHAVYQARQFVGDEPFLLMLGDHVYVSNQQRNCARQLLEVFEKHQVTVSAVQRTPESKLHLFGTVAGRQIADAPPTYEALQLHEKPSVEYARCHLRTPGLADGEYLCFFGMHVFEPQIFDCLADLMRNQAQEQGEIQLTSAQELLRTRQRYLVCEIEGQRYDIGVPEGLVEAQMGLALAGVLRDRIVEQLAAANRR